MIFVVFDILLYTETIQGEDSKPGLTNLGRRSPY